LPDAPPLPDTPALPRAPAQQRAGDRVRPARKWQLAGFLIVLILVAAIVLITLSLWHSPAG
jgi:hypothetical protein